MTWSAPLNDHMVDHIANGYEQAALLYDDRNKEEHMGSVPIELVYEQIVSFAREAGARRVTLFGSRARGTNLPKSDIDIAIEGCSDFAALEDRLQEELWSLLRIDVVNLDGPLSESLRHEIAKDGKVLYEEI